MDRLLSTGVEQPVTPARLAEYDQRVWLLAAAAALLMLAAGALAAARTPLWGATRARYATLCAARLGLATAVVFPLLVWVTGVSVNAGLTVFGFDAVGAGLELSGSLPGVRTGRRLGGGGRRSGSAAGPADGRGRTPGVGQYALRRAAEAAAGASSARTYPGIAYQPGPYVPSPGYGPPDAASNPYRQPPEGSPPRGQAPPSARELPGAPPPPPPRASPRVPPPGPSREGPPPPGALGGRR